MPTANFYIQPDDGWVQVTSAGVDAIRISAHPSSTLFVATGSSTPSADHKGIGLYCGKVFWTDTPETENFYVRTINFKSDGDLRVDVYSVPTTP